MPVGGGGLMSGTLLTRDARGRTDIRVTGVQPEESAALYHVLRGATMADVRHGPTIADGLAGGGDDGAVTNELIAKAASIWCWFPRLIFAARCAKSPRVRARSGGFGRRPLRRDR